MKIFLTVYEVEEQLFAGPNIHALSWKEANKIAKYHGLTVSGVLTDIQTLEPNYEEELNEALAQHEFYNDTSTENRTIH